MRVFMSVHELISVTDNHVQDAFDYFDVGETVISTLLGWIIVINSIRRYI